MHKTFQIQRGKFYELQVFVYFFPSLKNNFQKFNSRLKSPIIVAPKVQSDYIAVENISSNFLLQLQISNSLPRIPKHFSFSVEHNLGIASGLYLSKSCWNVQSAEEAYFRQSFTDFFSVFEFNIYLGILAQTVNVFWYALSQSNIQRRNLCFSFTVKKYFCVELHGCLSYHHFPSADGEVSASESQTAKSSPPAVVAVLERDLECIQSVRRFG